MRAQDLEAATCPVGKRGTIMIRNLTTEQELYPTPDPRAYAVPTEVYRAERGQASGGWNEILVASDRLIEQSAAPERARRAAQAAMDA